MIVNTFIAIIEDGFIDTKYQSRFDWLKKGKGINIKGEEKKDDKNNNKEEEKDDKKRNTKEGDFSIKSRQLSIDSNSVFGNSNSYINSR